MIVQIALQNHGGSDGINPVFGWGFTLCAHNGYGFFCCEAFVPEVQWNGECFCQGRAVVAHPGCLPAFAAVHTDRQARDDRIHLVLCHQVADVGEVGHPRGAFEDFQGAGQHPQRVADGDADAAVTQIEC